MFSHQSNYVTISMQHSPSWETNVFSPSQKYFPHFMESENSWPWSPKSTTCPHPEPDQSSLPLLSYLMKVYFNIIILYMPIYCFRISYLSVWTFDVLETNFILCRIGPKSSIRYTCVCVCVFVCVCAHTHQWNINLTFFYQSSNMTDNLSFSC